MSACPLRNLASRTHSRTDVKRTLPRGTGMAAYSDVLCRGPASEPSPIRSSALCCCISLCRGGPVASALLHVACAIRRSSTHNAKTSYRPARFSHPVCLFVVVSPAMTLPVYRNLSPEHSSGMLPCTGCRSVTICIKVRNWVPHLKLLYFRKVGASLHRMVQRLRLSRLSDFCSVTLHLRSHSTATKCPGEHSEAKPKAKGATSARKKKGASGC